MSINISVIEKYEASISGMTCSNCSNYLESALKKINFVKFANVNLITEKALIVIDTDIIKSQNRYYLNLEVSSNRENRNINENLIKKEIEKIGFTVNNILRINKEENKSNRFLNLIFKKIKLNTDFKGKIEHSYIKKQEDSNKIHNLNQLELIEFEGIKNETQKIELSECSLKIDKYQEHSENIIKNEKDDLSLVRKNQRKLKNTENSFFEIETDILLKVEIDFIFSIPGVIDFKQVNSYYRLEYDSSIIKGHELYSYLYQNLYKEIINNGNNEKLKNAYKITYINEFKKNTKEIYAFIPTTNFINLIIVIILLIAIMSFSMIFKNFDFAIAMRKNFLFGNIDSYLFMGLILSFTMIFAYGFRIYIKSFMAFWRSRLVNMETLITLGSISAIILTIINLVKLIQENKENILILLDNIIKENNTDNLKDSFSSNGITGMNMTNINSSSHQEMDLSEMTMHSAEAAAAVIAIFIIGKYVEEKAKNNIKKLTINMFSDDKILIKNKITYIKPGNKSFTSFLIEKKVDVGLLEKDDLCIVNSGDILLFDCIILKGSLEVNENSNYGFDNIVKRVVGDKLKSGSQITNIIEENTIVIVSDVVEQSLLFKVIKEMSVCLNQKLKFQHFIDKIVRLFVPLIIIISLMTFCIWLVVKLILVDFNKNADKEYMAKMSYLTIAFIFERAISILVVSCPCAFGLAIPTVTTISLNKALTNGILIKNLSILPEIRNANVFVFDKTGTMTVIRREVKIEYLKYLKMKNFQKNSLKNEKEYGDICCRIEQNLNDRNDNKIYNFDNERGASKNDDMIIVIQKNQENQFIDFPLYEAIAETEKSQKHPIAEIMYSFAIRKIQSKGNLNL